MIVFTFEHILNHISFSIIFILIILFFRTFLIIETTEIYNSIKKGMIMTFFCITTLLVTRWGFLNHFPISDLYESLIFLSWNFTSIYIVLYLKKKKNNFSTITALGIIFTQGFTTSGILTQTPKSIILIPALQSQWLMMHVSMIILGYAALLCGSLLSLTLLVIAFQKALTLTSLDKNNYLIKEYLSFKTFVNWNERRNILKNLPFLFYRNYCRFQLLQQLDRWSYRIISLGFVFLTIGIFSGAVWANEAWGSYWNWDPKETWAFITWILFTIYLHTYETTNLKLKSLNSAIVAFIGFFFIWICYFGVNIFGVGLHSYGSF